MNNVWLWRVQRLVVVPNILRGVEYSESQSVQEFALSQQATNWLETPACSLAQKVRNVVQLRNLCFTEVDLFLELSNGPVELVAGIILVHVDQILVAEGPDVFLRLRVIEAGNRISHPVVHGHLGDLLPAFAVDRVAEAGMVGVLDAIALRQDALSDVVEVVDIYGEPRNGLRANFSDALGHGLELSHGCLHIIVLKTSMEVDVKVDNTLIVCSLGRARRDRSHVDVVLVEYAERVIQDAWSVFES